MIKHNTSVAEPTEVIPTNGKAFKSISHKRALRKTQEGHERQVAESSARPAQANELLRHEIKVRRHAEELLLKPKFRA